MSEVLKIALSLSLSGTLLFFILLALKPLYKNKLSKRWQYYIWLIVVVRMLVPFTPETTLVGSVFAYFENTNVEIAQTAPNSNNIQSGMIADGNDITPSEEPQEQNPIARTAPSLSIQDIFSKVYENLWILWAAIAFALLIRKITMYQSFVRFVKAGRTEVADIEILNMLADVGETIGVKRPVELFINPLISSPMLLGFFHPYIILPSIELEQTELAYIMRHELTHYKHLDMFYKWLVQITVCLHWFNPFAYLLAKEINKCCELSCDEAIIRTMDKDEKKAYGDTLLNSLKGMGNYNDKLATVTLTEGAEQLKERLDAIMKFKKKSKSIVAITLALTTMLCVGATAVGAYAAPQTAIPKTPVTINTSNKAEVSYDKDYAKWDITHIDDTYYYKNEPVRIFMDLRADSSFANFAYNENGSIDLRLVRNSSNSIAKVEHMTKAEADEILSDLEENPSTKEDIKRLTLEEAPDDVRSAINSCDDKTWYVLEGHGRQFIYYNNLPHNYAYQYESKQNSLRIVDIGKSTSNYVLLSVPLSSNLTISYNSKSVTYKSVSQSNIKGNAINPTSYVIECVSEKIIVKQGGTEFKIEVDQASQNNYSIRDNRNVPSGERYYRYNKWDVILERNKETDTSAVFSSTVTLTIPESVDEKSVLLVTKSGNIQVDNLINVNLTVESENGKIVIKDTDTTFLSAKSENGDVEMKNVTSTGDIDAQSEFGSVSIQLGDSEKQYSVVVATEPTANITINGQHYGGGDYTIGDGARQKITLDGTNNYFAVSNAHLFNNKTTGVPSNPNSQEYGYKGASYWTAEEFTTFMQAQEQGYKKLLASGDITQKEFDAFVSADNEVLKEIQNGAKVSKSATGSIENGIGD